MARAQKQCMVHPDSGSDENLSEMVVVSTVIQLVIGACVIQGGLGAKVV
jgi:hypothetical protein